MVELKLTTRCTHMHIVSSSVINLYIEYIDMGKS